MRPEGWRWGRLFALLPFDPVMGAPVLRRLFALLPFAIIPFMFIYKEDSFSDVIRRKAAQKAALLFSIAARRRRAPSLTNRRPQAGSFRRRRRHIKAPRKRRFFIPCLFHFLPKGTVAHTPPSAFFTVPFTLFVKRHGSFSQSANFLYRAFSSFSQKARWRAPLQSEPCQTAMPAGTFSFPSLGGEEEKFALRRPFLSK